MIHSQAYTNRKVPSLGMLDLVKIYTFNIYSKLSTGVQSQFIEYEARKFRFQMFVFLPAMSPRTLQDFSEYQRVPQLCIESAPPPK